MSGLERDTSDLSDDMLLIAMYSKSNVIRRDVARLLGVDPASVVA